jgi:Fe-S-cluster containining protein
MADDDTGDAPGQAADDPAGDLAAGDFSSWMSEVQRAIRGEGEAHVPCDGCTACCTSSQFIHIGPDETDTLAHIPAELLFPAPRLPQGHVVLGYDQRGHCPMLIDNQCSIYTHRPRTCRTYDCRVFPATGVRLDDDEKELIARQARRWRFSFPTEADRNQRGAVRAAAKFLGEHTGLVPEHPGPPNATQRAVLAIEVHDTFLRHDPMTSRTTVVDPDPEVVRAEVQRRTRRARSRTPR